VLELAKPKAKLRRKHQL